MAQTNASEIMKNEIMAWYNDHPIFHGQKNVEAVVEAAQSGNIVTMKSAVDKYVKYAKNHAYRPDNSSTTYNMPSFSFSAAAVESYDKTVSASGSAAHTLKAEILAWLDQHPTVKEEDAGKKLMQVAESGNLVEMQNAVDDYANYATNHGYKPNGSTQRVMFPKLELSDSANSAFTATVTGQLANQEAAYAKHMDEMNKAYVESARALLNREISQGADLDGNGLIGSVPKAQYQQQKKEIADKIAIETFKSKTAGWTEQQHKDWENFVKMARANERSVERKGVGTKEWQTFSANAKTADDMKVVGMATDKNALAQASTLSTEQRAELKERADAKRAANAKFMATGPGSNSLGPTPAATPVVDPRIANINASNASTDVKNKAKAEVLKGNKADSASLLAWFKGMEASTPPPAASASGLKIKPGGGTVTASGSVYTVQKPPVFTPPDAPRKGGGLGVKVM